MVSKTLRWGPPLKKLRYTPGLPIISRYMEHLRMVKCLSTCCFQVTQHPCRTKLTKLSPNPSKTNQPNPTQAITTDTQLTLHTSSKVTPVTPCLHFGGYEAHLGNSRSHCESCHPETNRGRMELQLQIRSPPMTNGGQNPKVYEI